MKIFISTCVFICLFGPFSVFGYQTNKVVILVIDGARYTETFGDSTHQYVPCMWNVLRPKGTIFSRFYNDSITVTCSGHATILTGTWQNLPNDGTMGPNMPTVFEYFRKELGSSVNESYVILGKSKLAMLTSGNNLDYGAKYGASVKYCVDYSDDRLTWNNICTVLTTAHPRLAITNLGQVDAYGHYGDWNGYLASVRQADSIVGLTWNLLQKEPFYKDQTTLFVVNDHGRHSNNFTSHGDDCEGCRHIMCLMVGPDAGAGVIDSSYRRQTDIAPTIGELLDFSTPLATGRSLISVRPPASPSLSLPKAGATDQPVNLPLQWQPVRRAHSYRMQVATAADFLHPIMDTSVTIGSLVPLRHLSTMTGYYWRVCAQNSGGSGEWSEVRSFITGSTPAPEVRLLRPENGTTVSMRTVTMEWNASTSEVLTYWLELANDSLMDSVRYTDSSLTNNRIMVKIPQNNRNYWWRVRAGILTGWAEWSEARSFGVEVPSVEWPPETYACSFTVLTMAGIAIDVTYALVDPGEVAVTIYSLDGRLIASLYRTYRQPPGRYRTRVSLPALPGGCVIMEFVTAGFAKRTIMALP